MTKAQKVLFKRVLTEKQKDIMRCLRQGYTLKVINHRPVLQNPRISSNETVSESTLERLLEHDLIVLLHDEYFLTNLGREPLN